jgi:hypothetical protein
MWNAAAELVAVQGQVPAVTTTYGSVHTCAVVAAQCVSEASDSGMVPLNALLLSCSTLPQRST